MKNKKKIYSFSIIIGTISIIIFGVNVFIYKLLSMRILFFITLISYIVFLICYWIEKKRGFQ